MLSFVYPVTTVHEVWDGINL